jgi:cold shock CspA family protein
MAKSPLRKGSTAKAGPKIVGKVRPILQGTPTRGRIVRILYGPSSGFLRARDGRDVYFHRTDVEGGFSDLAVGDEVAFDLFEDAVTGPRALRLRKLQ